MWDDARQICREPAMKTLPILLALLVVVGCSDPAGRDESSSIVVIENVTLVDAVAGARTNQRIVVEDGVIASIQSMDAPANRSSSSIDAEGRFLIPGLWDMHVHFLYDERLTEAMADMFLDFGITSVRDTGGELDRLINFRQQLRSSGRPAPSVYISGPLLDGALVVYDGGDPGRPPLGTRVADKHEAQEWVARLKASGADFIKIYELVDPETFTALVEAAQLHGLPIASHVPLSLTAEVAGPLVNSMEHLRNVELACADNWESLLDERRSIIERFSGRGFDLRSQLHRLQRLPAIQAYSNERCDQVLAALATTIQVPTLRLNTRPKLLPHEQATWKSASGKLPETVLTAWQQAIEGVGDTTIDPTFSDWSLFLVGEMYRAGVPLGAGTDTPIGFGIPGDSLHRELELLVASGLSEQAALYAATVQPANFFGLQETIGQVAVGMKADLLLLEANPLDSISNTRSVLRVMKAGMWVR